MRKIKIAQIGTSQNSHGNMIWSSLKKQSDIFEIVGFAMPENERDKFPNNMAGFEGYNELTVDEILNNPEIEAVAIETEEKYLTKYALMAAEKAKHIHMEKPGGTVLADFEKLKFLANLAHLTFQKVTGSSKAQVRKVSEFIKDFVHHGLRCCYGFHGLIFFKRLDRNVGSFQFI